MSLDELYDYVFDRVRAENPEADARPRRRDGGRCLPRAQPSSPPAATTDPRGDRRCADGEQPDVPARSHQRVARQTPARGPGRSTRGARGTARGRCAPTRSPWPTTPRPRLRRRRCRWCPHRSTSAQVAVGAGPQSMTVEVQGPALARAVTVQAEEPLEAVVEEGGPGPRDLHPVRRWRRGTASGSRGRSASRAHRVLRHAGDGGPCRAAGEVAEPEVEEPVLVERRMTPAATPTQPLLRKGHGIGHRIGDGRRRRSPRAGPAVRLRRVGPRRSAGPRQLCGPVDGQQHALPDGTWLCPSACSSGNRDRRGHRRGRGPDGPSGTGARPGRVGRAANGMLTALGPGRAREPTWSSGGRSASRGTASSSRPASAVLRVRAGSGHSLWHGPASRPSAPGHPRTRRRGLRNPRRLRHLPGGCRRRLTLQRDHHGLGRHSAGRRSNRSERLSPGFARSFLATWALTVPGPASVRLILPRIQRL